MFVPFFLVLLDNGCVLLMIFLAIPSKATILSKYSANRRKGIPFSDYNRSILPLNIIQDRGYILLIYEIIK